MCTTIAKVAQNARADVSEMDTLLADAQKIIPSLKEDNFGNACKNAFISKRRGLHFITFVFVFHLSYFAGHGAIS